MNRTVKSLARRVANGTAEVKDVRAFKEAVSLLGWEGVRGGGVQNHTEGTRVRGWAALASILLQEAEETEANGAEAAQRTLAHSSAFQAVQAIAARVPVATDPERDEDMTLVYFYTTRVPTVRLSDLTSVDSYVTEEIPGIHEGLCQSHASLECSEDDPGFGFLRVLPESMLPNAEREQMIQCLPCYEASAEAYVRKLHRA